ncbi:MAG: metal ABC transporter substrate-binding protein [Candidatus Njordarchaeia archaeon]|nr:zinc ABC transporter substrate-binding protein [Candidatus Korarchaeota archaeon]
MEKKHLLVLILFISFFIIQPLNANISIREDSKPIVVATTTVLGSFVKELAGDYLDVIEIIPPGVCPAHYDVSPSDIQAIENAKLILGHGFEPWLDDIIESTGTNASVHKLRSLGPWNIPTNAINYIYNISQILSEEFPELSSVVSERAEEIEEYINTTAIKLKEQADELNVSTIKVAVMLWQAGFVSWLGFNVVATYPPPETMSTEDILEITSKIEQEGITIIIDNLQSDPTFGAEIASQAGIVHVVLTNFPDAVPGTGNYTEMIKYNAEQLFSGVNQSRLITGIIGDLREQVTSLEFTNKILIGSTTILGIIVIVEALVLIKKKGA